MGTRITGTGILGWDGSERRSDRYGTFVLMSTGYDDNGSAVAGWSAPPASLAGRRVRIVATVTATRGSSHIGDIFRGIYPTTPALGEEVDLGTGVLFVHHFDWPNGEGLGVGLRPDDGRPDNWMDPGKLYRLHDQTVSVVIETTDEGAAS